MSVSTEPSAETTYYHPRYWPIWALLGLGWSVAQLPFPWQLKLGRLFGRLLQTIGKSRRKITRRNLELCFPEKSTAEREQLMRKNFESLGLGFVEIAMAYWCSSERLHKRFTLTGIEHLEAARARDQGIMIVASHMTSLELILRLFSERWPSAAMYKPNHNVFFEHYSKNKRAGYTIPIPNKSLRTFLKHLKQGGTAIYLADQEYGRRNSVFAPFFGIQTATIKQPPEYIRFSGAALMPVLIGRNPDDSGYFVDVQAGLDFPSGDEVQDAATLNSWVEANIRRLPDQYLWQHRRFKTRPPGEPPLY